MSKDQAVLAFIAYHISGGRYGVKNAAGERVGEFIGSKEEAQAEADRLIKAQEEPVTSTKLAAGAGGNGAGDAGAGTTGQGAQPLNPGAQLGNLAGVVDQAGNVLELHQLPEEQLRKLAEDMDIEGHAGMTFEQLVAAIQAEDVVVGNPVYVVNRERLDHDGESYGFGDPIEFADPEHARALLLLGAILEDA